jgi:hypothetical protein
MKFTSALVVAIVVASLATASLPANAQDTGKIDPATPATQQGKITKGRSNIQNNLAPPASIDPAAASSAANPKSINKLKTKSNQANE